MCLSFPKANCSETILEVARWIPELAKVTKSIYTDIIKEYTPTASLPILLEIYIQKNIPILLKKREVTVSRIPLNKNNLTFLKKSPK